MSSYSHVNVMWFNMSVMNPPERKFITKSCTVGTTSTESMIGSHGAPDAGSTGSVMSSVIPPPPGTNCSPIGVTVPLPCTMYGKYPPDEFGLIGPLSLPCTKQRSWLVGIDKGVSTTVVIPSPKFTHMKKRKTWP